jgi:hypothetical protein
MPRVGRILITFVTLVTLVGSNVADWNRTHIFSELWSPHARFHGIWFVFAVSLLSLLSLWLVWSGNCQPDRARIAAFVQGCIWLAFFPGECWSREQGSRTLARRSNSSGLISIYWVPFFRLPYWVLH